MKFKWTLSLVAAALVAFLTVPAFACGNHGQSASAETITASTETAEPVAEPAAEPAAATEHNCPCGHGQQAADSDSTLTNAPAQGDVTCPHAAEAAAADDNQS
jgi:hypothetical protein